MPRPRASLVALGALCALAGCKPSGGPPVGKKPADAAPVAAAPPDASRPPKIVLPDPTPPPERPEGEPGSPEDLAALKAAAERGEPRSAPGAPPIERIDEHRVRVGRVELDRRARTLRLPGRLNMTEGILEYYAVGANGKLHESVLEVAVEPSHVHLGLLLLGLEPRLLKPGPDEFQPPTVAKPGSEFTLFVEWKDAASGERKRVNAEAWLYDRARKSAPKGLRWEFRGSSFWSGRYSADMDRSVIALIPDDIAVAGNSGAGNPYQSDAEGFEVHTQAVPPLNTRVDLVIEAGPSRPAAPGAGAPPGAPAPTGIPAPPAAPPPPAAPSPPVAPPPPAPPPSPAPGAP